MTYYWVYDEPQAGRVAPDYAPDRYYDSAYDHEFVASFKPWKGIPYKRQPVYHSANWQTHDGYYKHCSICKADKANRGD